MTTTDSRDKHTHIWSKQALISNLQIIDHMAVKVPKGITKRSLLGLSNYIPPWNIVNQSTGSFSFHLTTVYLRTHGFKYRINTSTKENRYDILLTSRTLVCSELPMNVPYRQLYKWSSIVISIDSLNSNAVGNCGIEHYCHNLGFLMLLTLYEKCTVHNLIVHVR